MYAKKSLGQNFLNSPHAIQDLVDAGHVSEGDMVLEIGPGKGVLTSALLGAGATVIAVEKDDRMIPLLEEKFNDAIKLVKLKIIHADILERTAEDCVQGQYKLIANIPYYITGELIRKFLEEKRQPELMVLMVQREVANRIVALDGKESILSISVKVYGKPSYIRTVKASAFIPAPTVDSAVLLIDKISKHFFVDNSINEEHFFALLKAGFAHKRKLLARNIETVAPKEKILEAFTRIGISLTARAEDLSLDNWKRLIVELK